MIEFNVLTEPWLTAVAADGREKSYGLLDLLEAAHQLNAIVDPSPPIQLGVYRFLVAFVQHALRMEDLIDLEDALEAGKFDRATFEAYADGVGRNRFDIFDGRRPFLQTSQAPGGVQKRKSVVELFYHLPTGSNVVHFFHMRAREHAISPAVAARALCSIAPFMMAGGAGYSPSINGAPPWYVLAVGGNLFETILLNCCVMEISGLEHLVPPAWVSDSDLVPKSEQVAHSLAEGLTWRPRWVRLVPSEGGQCTYSGQRAPVLVREMDWGPGHKFRGQDTWLDPQVAYLHDEKLGQLPLRPREGRQLWRDYGPLFLLSEKNRGERRFSRPVIVDQLRRLKADRIITPEKAELFEIYGMRTDKAKVFEWQHERMPLRTGVLTNPDAGVQVQHALGLAERVAGGLEKALKHQYPRDGSGNKKAHAGIIRRGQTEFWSQMEVYFEVVYLAELAGQERDDEGGRVQLLDEWKEQLRTTGWECFDRASRSVETGAEALRRQVLARNSFARNLSITLGGKEKKKVG